MFPFYDIHTHCRIRHENIIPLSSFDLTEDIIYDGLFTAGLHPWNCNKLSVEDIVDNLDKVSAIGGFKAVGEIGLDRACKSDFDLQKVVFETQLNRAKQFGLPVIIHCVRSFSEVFRLIKKIGFDKPFIVHGFHGNGQTAKQIVDAGGYTSFGKHLAFHRNTIESFKKLPPERIFFETDTADFLVTIMYKTASELTGKSVEFWKETVFDNFIRVFDTKDNRNDTTGLIISA